MYFSFRSMMTLVVAAGMSLVLTPATHGSEVVGILSNQGIAPAPVTVIAAKTGEQEITLQWNAVANAEGYRVYRAVDSGALQVVTANVNSTQYVDNGLANGTYHYKVQSFIGSLAADLTVSATTSPITITVAPNPPTTDNSGSNNSGGGGGGGTSISEPDTTEFPIPEPPVVPSLTDEEENTENSEEGVIDDSQGAVLGETVGERDVEIQQLVIESTTVATGDVSAILSLVKTTRNLALEKATVAQYTTSLQSGLGVDKQGKPSAVTNFIAYGTPKTAHLGAGERAGVLNSYKAAFGKLPSTDSEWADVLKIANGRWPAERSSTAEARATTLFQQVYRRMPDRSNPNDDAAVTIMAYGLRPNKRNLDSEAAAIRIFRGIYGKTPLTATEWDTVRAIAYSGATR